MNANELIKTNEVKWMMDHGKVTDNLGSILFDGNLPHHMRSKDDGNPRAVVPDGRFYVRDESGEWEVM